MFVQFALAAVLGGAASIISPCTFPILPPFLAFMAGMTALETRRGPGGAAANEEGRNVMNRGLARSVLFALGVLAIYSTTANPEWVISGPMWEYKELLVRIAGVFILGLGGWLWWKNNSTPGGSGGMLLALPAGLAFGQITLACCLGRVISAIQMTQAGAGRNVLLLFFMLGLGFVIVAAGQAGHWVQSKLSRTEEADARVTRIAAIVLIVVGLLVISGLWIEWLYDLQRYSAATKSVSIQLEEAILEAFNVAN